MHKPKWLQFTTFKNVIYVGGVFLGDYIYWGFCPFDWSEKQKILNKKPRNAHGKMNICI